MSPTIVLRDGRPWLALGSPGGSTIITTVLQVLLNRIDRGMALPRAVAAPRASQRNTASVTAEQAFIDAYGDLLEPYGHTLAPAGDARHERGGDRVGGRDRVRPERPAHRRGRAATARWRLGAGGPATLRARGPYR